MGNLNIISSSTNKAVVDYRGTIKNCYYLDGIEKDTSITPEATVLKFVKTSTNTTVKTSEEVITALNNYIKSNTDEVDTKDWCEWIVGDNGLPALDFNSIWNPTAGENGTGAFVKVNN